MSLRRRHFSQQLLAAAAAGWLASPSWAAGYNKGKPVRLLVGFPPGGGTDVIARLLAEKMKDSLGTSVVVENKPGAGGQIAAQILKASPADGATFFVTHDHTISILPQVVKNPGFDPHADFVPVAGFASFVNAIAVSDGLGVRTFEAYLQWLKKQGGKSAVGIPAPASTPEFLVRVLNQRFKTDLLSVPYRGSAPMLADMMGNQIPAGIGSVQDFIESHRAGKIRVLAVLGGKRQQALPDVPTFSELGLPGLEDMPYYGMYAAAGTPPDMVQAVSQAVAKAVAAPDVQEQLVGMGLSVGYMTPEQLLARERAYSAVWARIIRDSGFQPQ
ncbi:Bug family tripartite tricarboxylate transporter substrate binding protein [Comamonas sp. B21-038]|uniref:Bug family tripartite tricarboxylate transporter substrate binding protein n=1 Tax=Comamonas sp. B21-038 TaxID=2918299 RepID=UPI001EFB3973|nr:Bug family tripartite tricarboxylate transporter substrate binding protein [Comamonas sp. B21-038]ULR89681.1 Bug family tripartite tricarboxylate transporter substrate binding protein [Comamonas sp. B21-038]